MDHQTYRLHKDLPYVPGGHERQRLDLYLPPEGSLFPLIIWFHGGGFMRGSKEPSPKNQIPLDYLQKGFAVAAVGYRLSPETVFPGTIHDAKAAVGWLRQQAALYQLDASRFVAWGHSAGGYLSTMVGLTGWCSDLLGEPYTPFQSQVSAVISESSPVNFLSMDSQKSADGLPHNPPDSSESVFMGGPIQTIPELVKTANPVQYLNSAFAPRFLVVHGQQDIHIPYQQSLELVDALLQGNVAVDWHLIQHAGHFDIDRSAHSALLDAFLEKR